MISVREQEPEINICASDNTLSSAKRSLEKQNANGKPSKKQKVTPSPNSKSVPRIEGISAEPSSERNRQSDVSYRHLFGFANTTELEKESQPGKSVTPAFTFLNDDDQIEKTEKDKAITASRFLHNDENSDLNEIGIPHLSGNTENDMEIDRHFDPTFTTNYPDQRHMGNGHTHAPRSRRLAFQGGNRQLDERFETVRTQPADILMIPEDIESRPDEILRIATRFCRQKSVEELEEDWCAPGGIREMMRRDFKQKRQNITRGRKLGSSSKR